MAEGSASFFGGLLGGVSEGLLRRQMMQYESGMRDAESRKKAIDALLQSGDLYPEEVAPAIKALLAPTIQSPSIAEKFAGGVRRAVTGKKKATDQPNPMDQFFSSFESMRTQGGPRQPANAPLQEEQVGTPSQVPQAIGPVPEPRKTIREIETERAGQAEVGKYQSKLGADWQQRLREAETIDPTHGQVYQNYLAGWKPVSQSMRPLYGVNTPGTALPQNAIDLDGNSIPAELRTTEHVFRPISGGFDDQGNPVYRWVETAPSRGAESQGSEWERSFFREYGRKPTESELIKFRKSTQAPQVMPVQTINAEGKPVTAIVPKRAGTEYVRPDSDLTKRLRLRKDGLIDAEHRLGIMEHALANPNPQNDVALLFNHIGMTLSAQKGARITNAEIQRAITARSVPQDLLAMWQKVQSGQFLTPEQRQQMVGLARYGVQQARTDIQNQAEVYGIDLGGAVQGDGEGSPAPPSTPTKPVKTAGDLKAKYGIK